jgi:L-ribulose-5-phosphate 4-epimerase
MLLKDLRTQVLEANLEIVKRGLVLYTFGNASGIDRTQGLIVIKPSGVDYDELVPELMVVTDLHGKIIDGKLKPSSDLDTHTLLYREFPTIGAVVHTHSEYATSFAQAGLPIPPLGTTHADYFHGPVPCTPPLTDEAIAGRYVHETGQAIVNLFQQQGTDPLAVPACLVQGHAPFVWGPTPHEAAHNAVVLEAVARMAYRTLTLRANCEAVSQSLLDRHYHRKHGPNATYGQ